MSPIIAVDFDGTITRGNTYQKDILTTADVKEGAFEVLKALQRKGYKLALWTCRNGQKLYDAVSFCNKEYGFTFDFVNPTNADLGVENPDRLSNKPCFAMYIGDDAWPMIAEESDVWMHVATSFGLLGEKEKEKK